MQYTIKVELGINDTKIEDINGGEPTANTEKVNVSGYSGTINTSYTKPNINADDIIREAVSYSKTKYSAGSKKYSDATNKNILASKKTQYKNFYDYSAYGSDCAGLVYATLRHLGVRLVNFSDIINYENVGRIGPIPSNTWSWIWEDKSKYNETTGKGNVKEETINYTDVNTGEQKVLTNLGKYIIKPYVYNLKWENGDDLTKIVPYQEIGTGEGEVKNYGDFIEKNNIAKGSVIVTSNPAADENHMWFYIGKYKNLDEVKNYIKSLGITAISDDDINYYYVEGGSEYWSIECTNTQFIEGKSVYVTNRDPAISKSELENISDSATKDKAIVKCGNGYAAFTLTNEEEITGDYSLSIGKKSINDTETLIGNAEFKVEQYKNSSSTTNITSYGYYNLKNRHIDNESLNRAVTLDGTTVPVIFGTNSKVKIDDINNVDTYRITETKAPNGYSISTINGKNYVYIQAFKSKNNDKYEVDKLRIYSDDGWWYDLKSGEGTIYINSNGEKVSKKDSYVIELSFDSTSEDITFIWRDQKNDNYNLRIYKQSMNDIGWSVKKGLAGFGFEVVQKIDNNENSITVKTEEAQDTYVKLKQDSYNDGEGNVLLSSETAGGKIHTYEITETNDMPSGYEKAEFFRQGNTLVLEVVTEENTLAIKQVNVKRKDKNGNISNYWNAPIVAGDVKTEDWITITVSNKFGIIIGIKNPKITGKYPIDILKVSKENFNSNNSVKNNIEDNVSNSLDDARFSVISSSSEEYSDISSKAEVCKRIYNEKKAYSYSVSTQSGKKVSLLNDYEEQIIDNINTYDIYIVEERLAPLGYKVNNSIYALVVNKTIKENTDGSNRYAVDSIQVFISKDGGETFEEINISEGVNKDGSKYITNESGDYGVRFDYTDNKVIFTLPNDKVSTDYKLQVKKIDESGNPLQGVAFKVQMPSGNEITTEKTDKDGLTTIDAGTIDYNTIISDDKAFGFYKIEEVVSDNLSLIKLNEELTVIRYNSYNRLNSTIDVGFTLQGTSTNKREVTLSDGTKANVEINFDDSINTATLTIPNKTKGGSYNFKLTKTDVSGKVIANENTKFSVKVYESLSVTVGNKVTYGKEVKLKNTSGKIIDSSNLTAETGVTTGLDEIKIEDTDIGKTYYFVVNEDKAPDKHTKIDYTIVIPVEFSISGNKYIATKKDAFAVTSDNLKKELSDMSTSTNECVSTEQIDATINVKVPNKENIKGVYALKIKKVNASENDKLVGGVKFKVRGNQINGGEKTTLPTSSSTGETTVVINVKITKDNVNTPDEYTISEVDLGNNKLLKLAEEVKIKVNKFYDESDKSYKVKNVVFDNGKTEKEVKLENGETAIATVSGGVDEPIVITIPNKNLEGSYDFRITKTDISGKVIESEKTVFSVNVYGNMNTTNNKVTFSNKITLKKTDGTVIDSSNLTAKTGVTTGLDGIRIDDSAIKNKTYYFVVEEVQAPDEHTKIDYKVVVPVKFALSGNKYIATKQTAYAITSDGTKKTLSSMGTSTNECVSTEQTDVTINVKVPNKEIVKNGQYNIDLLKKNEDLSKPISGVGFNISCDTVAQANRDISTDTNGKISITNGTVEIIAQDANITKNNQTKVNNDDVYVINEVSAPTYLKLKNNISLTVKKGIADNQYKVTKIIAREISTSNSVSLAVGQQKEVTLKNVKLADNSTSVDIKISIDDKQNISITVPNKSITGRYNLKIKKYDQTTKKALEGVAFKINDANQPKTTHADGIIDVTGNVDIDNQNVNNDDTYKIEELENASVQNHVILAKPITVIVKKGEDSTGSSYIPKQITIKYTNAKGETVTNIGVNPITHTASKTTFNVLAKDGTVVSAMIEMSSDGTITLTVNNPEKTGEYSLQLYKTCINTNNEEKPFEGAWFYIQNSKSAIKLSRLTGENGYTKVISNTITTSNYKDEDVYTITEGQDLNDKIVKLKNGLTLKVTKKISSDNTKYVLDTITLSENNTNNTTGKITINETTGAIGTLNDVLLQDNRKVNISIGSNDNKIVIKIQNREIIGEYTLKIKKVNSVTGEAIDGVTFNVMKNKQTPYNVVTANEGIATAGNGSNINSSVSDVYEIKEEKLPDNLKNYLQITDFKFGVIITPTLNASKTAYVVTKDNVSITPIQVNGSPTIEEQRAVVEEAIKNFEVKDNVITLTVYNEPTTDYKLKINKVNLNNNETITSAKFTIYENDVSILDNNELATLGDYIVNKDNVMINKTYTYKIYENEAAPGYDNILKNAYIELEVVVDESGKVNASYRIRGNLDTVTSRELLELKKKFIEYTENTGKQIVEIGADNTVTLNIPNPKSTTPLNLYLNKHQLNSENGVNGARFNVRRLYVNKETSVNISDITNKFNTGTGVENLAGIITSTTNTQMLLDSLENVEAGDSYYYEIKEDSVPKNYISTYKKIILRAHINDDKTVTSTIITICTDDTTNWVQYNAGTHGKIISESVSGNNIIVEWANSVKYTVKLFKKQYKNSIPRLSNGEVDWNNMEGLEGATFTITQKTPTEKTVINNEIIYGSYEFENVEANTETKYEYEITEVATKEGFINMFEGLKINLYVTTSSDGSIITDKTSTYYTISGYKSQAQKKYVEDLVKLEATSNLVTIYIANKEIENNFDISLMKIADTQLNGNLVGVKDVEFEVFKPDSTGTTNWTSTSGVVMKTDKDGYLHITGLPIYNTIQTFRFREKSVPDGVTKIEDTWIVLTVDTRGISKASEITKDKISVSAEPYTSNGVNAISGLDVDLEGTTILLTVPNPVKNYVFQLLKTDELGTPINQTDGITAPIFSVYKYNDSTNNWDEEKFGPLSTGIFVDAGFTKPNTTYKYKIEEHNSKAGFINILEGYELYAYIRTNSNCEIGSSESEGTYYELVAKTGKTQKYTKDEILNNGYINFKVNKTYNDDNSLKSQTVYLQVKNPYEYRVRLEKKDSAGINSVNKATITAKRIDKNSDGTTYTLNKVATYKTEKQLIKNNVGYEPNENTAQTWEIKETDVEAPYINILGNNKVQVQVIWRDSALNIVEHQAQVGSTVVTRKFKVLDESGNDVTEDYAKYVDVSTEKVLGEWQLVVTIKDPLRYYVDINKVEPDDDKTPISGANLKITDGKNEVEIKDGKSSSGTLKSEIGIGESISYTITESSTIAGHTNVLKDKKVIYAIRMNEDETIKPIFSTVFDTSVTPAKELKGDEKTAVLKYIKYDVETTDEGYKILHFYIENPYEYKFKLDKKDTSGNLLNGTQIEVTSSNSGKYYLNDTSSMEFSETGLSIGDTVTYNIREIRTVSDSAYVNVFSNKIVIVVRVQEDGTLKTVMSFMLKPTSSGTLEQVPLSKVDFLQVNITNPDNNGIQTVELALENPVKIDVDIVKKQVGSNGTVIPNTEFTVVSSFSGEHHGNTASNGKLSFRENNIRAGEYTYKVTENNTASSKYINILKDKYMLVTIKVSADGSITEKSYKLFNSNGTEITDAKVLEDLNKYISLNVDSTGQIDKLVVTILNPVTLDFNLYKQTTAGSKISGAKFKIISEISGEVSKTTDNDNGKININENYVTPGVYKYEVIEESTAGEQYNNILNGCKLIIYVKVDGNGDLSIVKDKSGADFTNKNDYKYTIVNSDGSEVNSEKLDTIHKYIKISNTSNTNEKGSVNLTIINSINYKINIIKKDSSNKDLSGTKFTVIRDGSNVIFENKEVTAETEITESDMSNGNYVYYITENSTVPNSGYINMLSGKFIKVYTEVTEHGELKIKDSNLKDSANYFEIYEGNINNIQNAKLLDKTQNADLYKLVNVESVANGGIYTLNVKVENPQRDFKLVLNKKIFGEENINQANAKFKIISQFSGEHADLTTDKDGNIMLEEKCVPANTYKYAITETQSAGEQFKNLLDNVYVLIYVRVNNDGTVDIVDEDGVVANTQYYLYKGQDGTSLIDKIDLDSTNIDESIRVSKNSRTDIEEIDIFVKDPEFYNFELVKKDRDTTKKMNGVTFTYLVYDNNGKKVDLINAETLEEIVENEVTTKNVNGVDGVINIPNILIPKAGIYTYIFHEEPTDGIFDCLYKSLASDIHVDVEIVVQDNEYVIKSTAVTQGNKYVEAVSTTNKKAQTASLTVLNERIKGSYNLTINKLDVYTKEKLDGAKFNVTVQKDGSDYELYKVTENVEAKEVIIPGEYTVTQGKLEIPNIRIERPETYTITLTETEAPEGYMLLDEPIVLDITTGISGENDDAKYVLESVELISGRNHSLVDMKNDSESITVNAENEYFDLSLRKSITSISYEDGSKDGQITEDDTENRIPDVITDKLLANEDTTAIYNHNKQPIRAYASQYVIYTIRVYNEGEIDGYAEEISDHLPEYLEFVDDEFNDSRDWIYDSKTRTARTTYLSQTKDSEKNLIKAMNKETGELDYKEVQIKCKISSTAPVKSILTNIAEISISKANDRTSETVDRDSTTNNVKVPESSKDMSDYKKDELDKDYVEGQEDDDDFEKLIIEEFDLALRKYIVAVNDEELLKDSDSNNVTDDKNNKDTNDSENTEDENNKNTNDNENTKDENNENTNDNENTEDKNNNNSKDNEGTEDGKNTEDKEYAREPIVNVSALKEGSSTTATYTHPKDPVEVSVDDIVTYTIEVFNEGTVSGYASLIKDDIPEGVEFVTYEKGDGSTNDIYRWKMVDENDNEVTDPSKAKYVVSDYLSKANEESEGEHLLKAYDYTSDKLDSKYVKIEFRVICKQDYPKIITNYAQISEDTDESGKDVRDRDSTPNEWKDEDDEDIENIKVTYLDLALRKFITAVNEEVVTSRIPQVDSTALIEETGTTATYTHPKDPVLVHTTDIVTYTLRVYNEGSKDGYATQIKDDIPEGLEFVVDNQINKEYGWKLVDENDNEVTDISKAKYVVTNYLSKDNEKVDGEYMMKAFDRTTMDTPDHREVKIAFRVVEPTTSDRVLINYAQISDQTDGKGKRRDDRDSTPNEWKGEDDEDIEKVKVLYFDLALRKWVTQAIVTENGKTTVHETGHHAEDDPEEVVKVDLKKRKINSVEIKFRYSIRITNEGEIAGAATEISDYIPSGLKFVQEDNPDWREEDGKVVTNQLAGVILQPGESAEVEILLTWINGKENMGVMINTAEISEDYNKYDTPDIDSTPNNKVPGEDDIDDAPVMLAVKTGSELIGYVALLFGFIVIIGLGVNVIRKKIK